jgi:hypothetical protein
VAGSRRLLPLATTPSHLNWPNTGTTIYGTTKVILVQRRWFVPPEKLASFVERWRNEIKPAILQRPGCIRVEIFESSIRGHWVTSVLWVDETSRMNALSRLASLYTEFREYERFEAEVLTVHPEQ